MNETIYMNILRFFLASVPIGLVIAIVFARSCIRSKETNQPGFWLALVYIGVLFPETIRAIFILQGDMPPHPKQIQIWMGELAIFGGFWYAVSKRYLKVVWDKLTHD